MPNSGRLLRWAALAAGGLLLLFFTAPLWLDANAFRPLLESNLASVLGREVKLGDLKLAFFSGALSANDLAIADDPVFSRTPFVRAKSVKLSVELWPMLFSHRLNVTGLTIDQPEIELLQSPGGDWNFSKLGSPPTRREVPPPGTGKGSIQLSVKLVKITSGRFSLSHTTGHLKPFVLEGVDFELKDFSYESVFPFTLSASVAGGGSVTLKGQAGPIDQADLAITPFQASLGVAQLDLAQSGLTAQSPALAGLLSLDGTGDSRTGLLQISGKLALDRLRLATSGTPAARPLTLDLALTHDLRKQSGRLTRGDIHLGKAAATLSGTYARQDDGATAVRMTLSGPKMPVPELAVLLPSLGIVLPAGSSLEGGTADARFDMQGPVNALVTAGSASLNNTKLTGFNLGQKMTAVERFAGIQQPNTDTDIQTLSAQLRVAPEGTRARDVKLIVPAIGDLTGDGTISPSNALDFKMSAALHTAGFLSAIDNRPIPFAITGTCSDPAFRPDFHSLAGEAKKAGGNVATRMFKNLIGGRKKK